METSITWTRRTPTRPRGVGGGQGEGQGIAEPTERAVITLPASFGPIIVVSGRHLILEICWSSRAWGYAADFPSLGLGRGGREGESPLLTWALDSPVAPGLGAPARGRHLTEQAVRWYPAHEGTQGVRAGCWGVSG